MTAVWQPILDFWFLHAGQPGHGKPRAEWFRKDAAFDETIRERFDGLIEQGLAGSLVEWDANPHGALARILLLDQFTRNIFRDHQRAFAGDALALRCARDMVDHGRDSGLQPLERWFVYLPFMHAENLELQERSVALFKALHQETGEFAGPLDYAIRHRDIIARFGRFPHRNAILGRISTDEERIFLSQPGSGF